MNSYNYSVSHMYKVSVECLHVTTCKDQHIHDVRLNKGPHVHVGRHVFLGNMGTDIKEIKGIVRHIGEYVYLMSW